MKPKKAIIIAIALVIFVGAGAWAFFSSRSQNTSPSQQSAISTVKLNIPNSSLELAKTSKSLDISVDIEGTATIARVEYLLDGEVVARSIEPPYKVTISLAKLKKGEHTLQAIAYDTSGGSAKSKVFTFTIDDSDTVTPANDESQTTVEESTSIPTARASRVTTAKSGGSSGSSGTSNNNDGGTPTPTDSEENYRTAGGWYGSLPPQLEICSNNGWNGGPSSAPAGSNTIIVPAGDNTGFNFTQDNKIFWFAPGEHTLGTGQFSQIVVGNNSTYIGAPTAVLNGNNNNQYAFTGNATNVRIAYLEVKNFGRGTDNQDEGVINHNAADNWTMEYLYAHHNDGAAVFLGSNNTVRYNCLKDNGQYGFSMFKDQIEGDSAIKDIVLDHNEISGNNQDNWEVLSPGCGCTGGGKFWDVKGATVTNNYVHDNLSTGLWADTNDIDFLFDSNWIEHNSGEGIWYEISYNATISRNTLKRNAWVGGNRNTGSPAPAIYISESGGDSRLQSTTSGSTNLQIKNNLLEDNFSGVSVFENSNRFCDSNGNTSKSYCTPFVSPTIIPKNPTTPPTYDFTYPNPIGLNHPCYTSISSAPYTFNCRWHSQNVKVFNNEFRFTAANVPCAGTFCGVQALFATGANNIPWAPAAYNIGNIQNDVMFNNGNKFSNNTYIGDWRFAKGSGETINWNIWQLAPFNQDTGSTISGQTPVANALDTNTATLEGSIGQWQSWFTTNIAQSTLEAHSGTHSMKIDTTGGGSWGVQLANYPGFRVTPGSKHVSFWAKKTAGTTSAVRLQLTWRDSDGNVINPTPADLTLSGLNSTWQQASVDMAAPNNVSTVFISFLGTGSLGDTVFIDDIVVGDN
ncbi:MAG TPA: right-handed parallel beta-helix repeat-containing protein [Candidatus Saccharimonadales bacterium]|nr:right-handed parallel beta-helix repeat-containing protein [Candidatus Saccharimonadales bacterium]